MIGPKDDDGFIIYGDPEPPNLEEGCGSLGEMLKKRLLRNSNDVALINGVDSMELRYLELLEKSIRLAVSLRSYAGIGIGDVVGIVSENCLEFPVVLFASFLLGAAVAPVNVTYTERECEHAFDLSKPKVVFTSSACAGWVVSVAQKKRDYIQRVIMFGTQNDVGSTVTLFEEFQSDVGDVNPLTFYVQPVDISEQNALIVCSSGTTGLPKGVQLTQRNLIACIGVVGLEEYIEGEAVLLGVIPWFHIFGCMTLINILLNKTKMVFLPRFEERAFLRSIEQFRCTLAFMVPPLVVFLAKNPLVDEYDLSSMKTILSGAAPLGKEIEDLVKARIGIKTVCQGYGMSETTLSMTLQTKQFFKPGSVGKAQVGVMAKVIDPETGRALGPNKPGELCFKSSQIMKGYIGNEEATRATIDPEGWLHSGDVGYYDDDQEIFIVDRLKELIKYKAFQVPPAEIEAILLSHPKIKDAAVIGVPDEMAGELPAAFVVPQQDVTLTEDEVKEFIAKQVSSPKRLRGGVRFIDEIPKNASGKILRRKLRELLKLKSKL